MKGVEVKTPPIHSLPGNTFEVAGPVLGSGDSRVNNTELQSAFRELVF